MSCVCLDELPPRRLATRSDAAVSLSALSIPHTTTMHFKRKLNSMLSSNEPSNIVRSNNRCANSAGRNRYQNGLFDHLSSFLETMSGSCFTMNSRLSSPMRSQSPFFSRFGHNTPLRTGRMSLIKLATIQSWFIERFALWSRVKHSSKENTISDESKNVKPLFLAICCNTFSRFSSLSFTPNRSVIVSSTPFVMRRICSCFDLALAAGLQLRVIVFSCTCIVFVFLALSKYLSENTLCCCCCLRLGCSSSLSSTFVCSFSCCCCVIKSIRRAICCSFAGTCFPVAS
mmetsp:Transcript_30563/g.51928  ORF Transcript_30563/g.51928 Transcript_30563/m.51928 type:complete len:286 (-) Transcript_30563:206-1063(-)